MLRAEHAQKRLGMHRAGAHLDVERLLQEAAARGPELRQLEDELLQRDHSRHDRSRAATACRISRSTRADFNPSPDAGSAAAGARSRARATRAASSGSDSSAIRRRRSGRLQELQRRRRQRRCRPPARTPAHEHVRPAAASTAPRGQRLAAARTRARERRIHALQPQQPVLEVPRQRLDRRSGRDRVDHRRPSRYSRSSACASGAHSSISSAKYPTCPSASPRRRRQRRPRRLDVVEPDQIALLALVIRDAGPRHRLERADVTATAPAARPSPRRASCPDRASGTPRSDRPRPACRCEGSALRTCKPASGTASAVERWNPAALILPRLVQVLEEHRAPAPGTKKSRTRRSAS